MRKSIAAYTPAEYPYPPYLSINQMPNGDMEITVRGPAEPPLCGVSAAIVVPRHEWTPILRKLMVTEFKNEDGE